MPVGFRLASNEVTMQPPYEKLTHVVRGLDGYHCRRHDTGATSTRAGSVSAAIASAIQEGHGPYVGFANWPLPPMVSIN